MEKITLIPNYNLPEGINVTMFYRRKTATNVFMEMNGEVLENITYQSNLYGTQKTKISEFLKGNCVHSLELTS